MVLSYKSFNGFDKTRNTGTQSYGKQNWQRQIDKTLTEQWKTKRKIKIWNSSILVEQQNTNRIKEHLEILQIQINNKLNK